MLSSANHFSVSSTATRHGTVGCAAFVITRPLLPLIGELAFKSEFANDAAFPFFLTDELKNNPVELGYAVLQHLKKRAEAVKERDPDEGAAALLLLDNVSEPALLSPAQLACRFGAIKWS